MSQDLFAAFGDLPAAVRSPQSDDAQRLAATTSVTAAAIVVQADDDDDFGDFEDAAVTAALGAVTPAVLSRSSHIKHQLSSSGPPAPSKLTTLPFELKLDDAAGHKSTGRHPFADHMDILFSADDDEYDAGQDEWQDLSNNPEAAMAYSKRVIQEQMDAANRAIPSASQTVTSSKPNRRVQEPNVLFDAENITPDEQSESGEGDDWGEFEVFEAKAATRQTSMERTQSEPVSMDLLGLDDVLPAVQHVADKPSISRASKPIKASQTLSIPTADDPWDDFDAIPDQHIPTLTQERATRLPMPATPPTHIPPPSVLLSEISSLLKVVPNMNTVHGLVLTAYVAAHIVAGRKLRWKRSTALAASMRIGPAASSKRGMKLVGVDKAEAAKEDREVAEALTVWRAKIGKLRTAVIAHNATSKTQLRKSLELAEAMPLRVLKPVDGGFTAPHECALCGLRREERVAKVDDRVDDSFGEWWIEGASMHTSCAEWWVTHEGSLRSR